jgi:eukaryotic-like serine/threonine-protein kinase
VTEDLQRSLERYDVLDRIAVGGMAEVFLAKAYGAHGFEKTLAIKRILPELARDREFEERFIAEAKVAVRLSHANVVQVFDFGRFEESLFIAMEYVDGLDLAALLRRVREEGRNIPLPAAFHIAIEIMRGLDFAHQHGVVHRDVSPSNILISRAGEVKIADFGIAVAARSGAGNGNGNNATGPRKVMGKWRYMSPEQARGDRLDTRSDLFSAAAVIFELFTGVKLFPGVEAEDIIKNIHEMPIPKVGSVRPGLPSRLDEILGGPLARRPLERPNRPALTLRSLIELSYESSIVATALDVADAVNAVLPPREGARSAIDDVLRKQMVQLGESSMRRTAVTSGRPRTTSMTAGTGGAEKAETTGVWLAHVDSDGLSHLEIGDGEPVPSTSEGQRSARARRTTPDGAVVSGGAGGGAGDGDGGPLIHGAGDVSERFRRTEVGATPSGREDGPQTPLPVSKGQRPAWTQPWKLLAGAVVAAAVVLGMSRPWGDRPVVLVPIAVSPDAAIPATGVLDIDSDPSGATGAVDGVPFGPTPSKVTVPAGVALKVVVEREGYEAHHDDHVEVPPGQTVRMRPVLTMAPARLHVSSDPTGSHVTLAGRPIGTTPLDVRDLTAGANVMLTIAHDGFSPVTQKITLRAGQVTTVHEVLKPGLRYGKIDLYITDGWAEIYVKNRKVGRAPVQGLALPVGKQRLLLVNPLTGRRKTMDVEVDERKPSYYRIALGT